MYSLGLVLWEVVSATRTVKYYSSSSPDGRSITRTRSGLGQYMGRTRSSNSPAPSSAAALASSPGTLVSLDAVEISPTISYGTVPYAECKSNIGRYEEEEEE